MSRGVYAVARGLFDHPFFRCEPFTEREAWLWLLEAALWKAGEVRVRNGTRKLGRGQLAYSTRFMAERWKWSEARVRRFLGRLKIDAMIDAETDAQTTVVTICNYSKWQAPMRGRDAVDDAADDARATQIRRREYSDTNVSGAEAAPTDIRKVLFAEGLASLMRQTGKAEAPARRVIGGWLKTAKDDAARVLTKIRQAEADRVAEPIAWVTAALKDQNEYSFLWARG